MNILDWIDIGKVSAERDDLLSEYFYDNGVLTKLIESRSLFLLLGRKGAGKTAVFKHLTENPSQYLKSSDILVSLSFEDYNWNIHSLLVTRETAGSLAYKQSWKFVILVETVKALVKEAEEKGESLPKALQDAAKLLKRLFDDPVPPIYSIIGRKLLSLSRLKLPGGAFDLESGDFDKIELTSGEVSFDSVQTNPSLQDSLSQNVENVARVLEKAIESSRGLGHRVYLAFDRVDEAWDEISIESSKRVIAGLVSAADSVTADYGDFIRPLVFLREDIFDVLSLNDSNKLREDCGALLHWNKDSLFNLILRRINYFGQQASVKEITDLDALFDKKEMRQRTRPSNYLLKRSMMRPRDLICILRRTIDAMKEEASGPFAEAKEACDTLEADAIYDAEPGYSDWLKLELTDEWGVQKPEIEQLFEAIQNHGSTNLTLSNLVDEFAKFGISLQRSQVLQHLRFLFDNSIVGFKSGASNIWRYKCFYPSQGFVDSEEYRVHEGLVRALNLKEPREREELQDS